MKIDISQAAKKLGVSVKRRRRWDKDGTLALSVRRSFHAFVHHSTFFEALTHLLLSTNLPKVSTLHTERLILDERDLSTPILFLFGTVMNECRLPSRQSLQNKKRR